MAEQEARYLVVFQVDMDLRIDQLGWEEAWVQTRYVILRALGFEPVRTIRRVSPSGRGLHFWFHCLSPRLLTDHEKNLVQFLLGDDIVRCRINYARIRRGVGKPFIMFDHVRWKRPLSERCRRCRLRRAVMSLLGEEEEPEPEAGRRRRKAPIARVSITDINALDDVWEGRCRDCEVGRMAREGDKDARRVCDRCWSLYLWLREFLFASLDDEFEIFESPYARPEEGDGGS